MNQSESVRLAALRSKYETLLRRLADQHNKQRELLHKFHLKADPDNTEFYDIIEAALANTNSYGVVRHTDRLHPSQ